MWLSFPKLENLKVIAEPDGPGVYQLRHKMIKVTNLAAQFRIIYP